MNGKSKCKILKDIRRQIAEQNDIAFVTSECKFQGNCSGTCPKCEAEVRYLEEELRKRQRAGMQVAVAGIATALVITSSGCLPAQTGGDPLPNSNYTNSTQLQGDIAMPTESTEYSEPMMGAPETLPTESTLPDEPLMGEPVPVMGDILPDDSDLVDGEMLPPETEDGE